LDCEITSVLTAGCQQLHEHTRFHLHKFSASMTVKGGITMSEVQTSSLWATIVPTQTATATATLAFHNIRSNDST
jgi:hypothetical protein